MNQKDIQNLLREARLFDDLDDRIIRALDQIEREKNVFRIIGRRVKEINAENLPHLAITWYPSWMLQNKEVPGILDQTADILREMQERIFNWETGGKREDLPYDQRVVAVKNALFFLLATRNEPKVLSDRFNKLDVAKRIPIPTTLFESDEVGTSIFFSREESCFYALHAGFLWGGPNRLWQESRECDLYRDFVFGRITEGDISNLSMLQLYGVRAFGFSGEVLQHEFGPRLLFRGGLDASGVVSLYTDMPHRGAISTFMEGARDSKDVYPYLQEGDGFCYPLGEGASAVGIFLKYVDPSELAQGFYAVSAGRISTETNNPDRPIFEGVRIARYKAPISGIQMALIRRNS